MPEIEAVAVESGATVAQKSWQDFAKRNLPAEKSEVKEVKQEKPVKAESGTADQPKEVKPEAKAESAAESGAAQPQEKPKKDKLNVEERIAQLTRENKELKAERERSREQVTKPAAEQKPDIPKRPNPFKWEGTPEEYDAALEKYEAYQMQKAVSDFQQNQRNEQAMQQFMTKVEETRKAHPDFDTVADAAGKALLEVPQEVQAWFRKSPYWGELIYTIGSKQEFLDDFVATAKSDVVAAFRKLAFLEIEVGNELSKANGKAEDKTEAGKEAPAETKPRTPKPPAEVGGRGVAAEDVALSAVQSKNFRRAETEWTRRYLASKGG